MFPLSVKRLPLAAIMTLFLVGGFPSSSQGEPDCTPQIDIQCGYECYGGCRYNSEIPITAGCIQQPEGGPSCGYSDPQWYCQCLYGAGGGF